MTENASILHFQSRAVSVLFSFKGTFPICLTKKADSDASHKDPRVLDWQGDPPCGVLLGPRDQNTLPTIGLKGGDVGQVNEPKGKAVQPQEIQGLFAAALKHLQVGRLADAGDVCRQILAWNPRQPDALHMLGVISHQFGRKDVAVGLIQKAIDSNEAAAAYHCNLGVTLMDLGRLHDALPVFDAAICLNPRDAIAHYNRGNVLRHRGRLDEALGAYETAVLLNPNFAEAYCNSGNVLLDLGRLRDALAAYDVAISAKPCLALLHYNRGNVLKYLGHLDAALGAYENAVHIDPNYAEAHSNLGNVLADRGRFRDALAAYDAAISTKPDYAEAYANRCLILLDSDRAGEALTSICRSLQLNEMAETKAIFTVCMKHPEFTVCGEMSFEWVWRALREFWAPPNELARSVSKMIRNNRAITALIDDLVFAETLSKEWVDVALETLGREPLLTWLLSAAVLQDIGLEKLLTTLRTELLIRVSSKDDPIYFSGPPLQFACYLAKQCFINEYIFNYSVYEEELTRRLLDTVSLSISNKVEVSSAQLAVLGCYVSLHSISDADWLLGLTWPDEVYDLLVLQISEPTKEWQIRSRIRRITDIHDKVSAIVRQQYEENPYPRWTKIGLVEAFPMFDDFLRRRLPAQAYRPQHVTHPSILVAGCGTGKQPIELALRFPSARLLAVDLSLASLAHAQRRAEEMGLTNIEFAQADLLKLGEIGCQFDVIEAVGVLHHLSDPLEGMGVLISLLRPNGLMKLGLYSELARAAIGEVRHHISKQGYSSNSEDIRRCRGDVFALPDGDPRKKVVQFFDFFSLSECRDLLFHVQEHLVSIPDIAVWLNTFDLTFVGFDVAGEVRRRFRRQFHDPMDEVNLSLWLCFEEAHPRTFSGMYQFWVQKSGNLSPGAGEELIRNVLRPYSNNQKL